LGAHVLRTVSVRLVLLVPVLFLVSVGTFVLVELVPGDPAQQVLGPNGTIQEYQRVRTELGLDEPITTRYVHWLGDAITGDLGRDLVPPSVPVSDRLQAAFPVNLELAGLALGMAVLVSIPLATWSAYRAGSRFERWTSATMFGVISVPSFLAGIILIVVFTITWRVFPLGQWARPTEAGWGANLHHAFLPAFTLALAEIAVFTRVLRDDMVITLGEDFILAARARGLPTAHVLVREALRPSSLSLLTLAGVSLGRLIGGSIIVEQLFSLPGVGRAVVEGAQKSDYTIVQGGVLVLAVFYISLNLVVDLLYGVVDPRIRRGRI
jgi:peptide/nickel transport system permease protein